MTETPREPHELSLSVHTDTFAAPGGAEGTGPAGPADERPDGTQMVYTHGGTPCV